MLHVKSLAWKLINIAQSKIVLDFELMKGSVIVLYLTPVKNVQNAPLAF